MITIILVITILITIFLAINMGSSGFSVSFTPSCGAKIVTKNKAIILYMIFVFLGAFLIGDKIVQTLTEKLIKTNINKFSAIIIVVSTRFTMFITNLLKIPQSTSVVTLSAFTGAGLYLNKVNFLKIIEILIVAIIFSFLSFIFSFFIMKLFYPPKKNNFHFYEKLESDKNFIRKFIIITNYYSSFAVGTNNVANAVTPFIIILLSFTSVKSDFLLTLFAPIFGIGVFLFGKKTINTISNDIIPIGELSAVIISIITSTLVVFASILGLPTHYVQFITFSVLGIGAVKEGTKIIFNKGIVKKIFICMVSYINLYKIIKLYFT